MTQPAHAVWHSLDEYAALEAHSNVRHEYLDGRIYAMAGGTPEHAARAALVLFALVGATRGGPSKAYSSDLSVRVAATGLVTYPDAAIVCPPVLRDTTVTNAVLNPAVLVEVLSPSTAAYDRGDKLSHYQRIPSLREIVLVDHASPRIEVLRRVEGVWTSVVAGPGERLTLDTVLAVDVLFA